MLSSDFPFGLQRWPQRLLAFLLGEPFLGFLAIIATALTMFPMLFATSARVDTSIDLAQWAIIGWFAFEYVFALATARNRRAFLRDGWRWLDLVTIVVPLASLLPTVSSALRSSPVLRLIRLVRLVTLGVRASGAITRGHVKLQAEVAATGPAEVLRVAEAPSVAPAATTWEQLVGWLRARGPEWYHVANPSPTELAQIGAAAGLPAGFLETHLVGTSYPHAVSLSDCSAVFLWSPELDPVSGRVDRHALLLVAWPRGLLSLSRRPTALVQRMEPVTAAAQVEPAAFPVQMILREIARVLRQNETIVARFEQELHALEDVPVRESRPVFFERTFRLKKELSAAQSDLWRLRSVLADLAEQRHRLPGMGERDPESFGRLSATAVYLYETVVNIREEALSVIELHLNVVSFDMNRVMRVLAVVSVLGLIPAVIGGLFGMNLVDNPWPFTLPQVAFVICFGMLIGLYLFFVKGWLR
jgi:Mg2+ and Co2+ transporter CorA